MRQKWNGSSENKSQAQKGLLLTFIQGPIAVLASHPSGTKDIMLSHDPKWKILPQLLGQHGTHTM